MRFFSLSVTTMLAIASPPELFSKMVPGTDSLGENLMKLLHGGIYLYEITSSGNFVCFVLAMTQKLILTSVTLLDDTNICNLFVGFIDTT
jgi:hypothetical protein